MKVIHDCNSELREMLELKGNVSVKMVCSVDLIHWDWEILLNVCCTVQKQMFAKYLNYVCIYVCTADVVKKVVIAHVNYVVKIFSNFMIFIKFVSFCTPISDLVVLQKLHVRFCVANVLH